MCGVRLIINETNDFNTKFVINILPTVIYFYMTHRASDFAFQKKQFSVSKKVKFRFDSVSLLATLNSMKSQYIERKCGERTVKMTQLVR